MKYCENCGAQLEDSAKFCEECGTKVEIEEIPQPKNKNKKILIIALVIVLIFGLGGGIFYYMNSSQTKESTTKQETVEKKTEVNKSLKDGLKWSNNQEQIDSLKEKEFESKPIGRILDGSFSTVTYKYASEGNAQYLYCDFVFDGNPIIMIFKITDSVELAEMYSENKLVDDNAKKSYIENIFYSDLAEQALVAAYMPTKENYCNNLLTDGVPHTCEMIMSQKSNRTFSFYIIECYDDNGFKEFQTIFDEHIATFESLDSHIAKCQNGNATITFHFNDDGSFTLSGLDQATIAGNQYSADNYVYGN